MAITKPVPPEPSPYLDPENEAKTRTDGQDTGGGKAGHRKTLKKRAKSALRKSNRDEFNVEFEVPIEVGIKYCEAQVFQLKGYGPWDHKYLATTIGFKLHDPVKVSLRRCLKGY